MSASNIQKGNRNKRAVNILIPSEYIEQTRDIFEVASCSSNETLISIKILNILTDIKDVSWNIDNFGNILITKGEASIYPCFCAHLDTVHQYANGYNIRINDNYLTAYDNAKIQIGCGGDDKSGINNCLYILKNTPVVKIVFFSQEESGGTGSSNVNLDFFNDCAFLGGIDRWNGGDFVSSYMGTKTISKAFIKDFSKLFDKYSYKHNSGLFTDCFNVQERGLNISCFNMSCGYYAHHSDSEYVDIQEMYNSYLFALELCKVNKIYEYTPVQKLYNKHSFRYDKYYTNYNDFNYVGEEEFTGKYCENCGTDLEPYEKNFCTYCKKGLGIHDTEISEEEFFNV